MKEYPIPKTGQNPAEFIKEAAEKIVKDTLKNKMVEMFSKPEPTMVQMEGEDLFILDTIYDVWPNDENKGKSAKLIFEIVQGKIRDYSRIYDDYEYKNSEHVFNDFGVMKLLFHFTKKTQY